MPSKSTNHAQWACPKCRSQNLSVVVTTSAKLVQSEENIETEAYGSHEWDGASIMICDDCHASGTANDFSTAVCGHAA